MHPVAELIQEKQKKYQNNLPLFMNMLNVDLRPYYLRTRMKYVLIPFYSIYEAQMDEENWSFGYLEKRIKGYERQLPKDVYQKYMEEYQHWKRKETTEPAIIEMHNIRKKYGKKFSI